MKMIKQASLVLNKFKAREVIYKEWFMLEQGE